MAETVVSMARVLVGSAVSKAASAAADEASLLLGVQKEIWYIKDELKTIQAFLRAAEVAKKKDDLLKVWAEQVQDLSYDIEDCLDEFKVHVKSQSLSRQLMKLGDRHRIAVRIRDLKSRVEEVSNRNTRYSLIKPISSSSSERDCYLEDIRNQSANNMDESELVGFATPKKELLKLLDVSTDDGPAKVICVVGMGGLGKTTLARKTYESKEDIPRYFSCWAWVTVSQSFDRREILKDMIMQLLGADSLYKLLNELQGKLLVQVHHLADCLVEGLKEKRYFVVLDDLWTIEAWSWINDIAFPKSNKRGSRILITTRDAGLAVSCTSELLIYHLEPLQIDDAVHLLLRKTDKRDQDMESDENMISIVTKLVKKCGCLPLAILTIGGILVTKKITDWGKIYKELPSELESNPSLEAMRRMVTLSYNHLPYHLKPCFLYLSIFPEDSEIQRRRLIDRWVAEGFVRARDGVNIEDVGNSHFSELLNRSLIQPSRVNVEGVVKTCRVHDIIRDIIVSISREENFVLLRKDNITTVAEENIRHVAFHGNECSEICLDWSHVRSISVFGDRPMEPASSFCSSQLRMLRVLDLENAKFRITQKDVNNIGLLRHMKYLNVARASYIFALPRSIGKLRCLQTLDIRESNISALTTKITELRSLRRLCCSKRVGYGYFNVIENPKECMTITMCLPMIFTSRVNFNDRANLISEIRMACTSCWSDTKGVSVPRGINHLKELQVLEVVDIKGTSKKAIEEIGDLSQLRKLSVTTKGATENKYMILCAAIRKLSSLQSLYVDAEGSSDVGTLEWLTSISSPPPLLRTLKLNGSLGDMPSWVGNLKQLVKLHLSRSRLKEVKMMEILGALPNLMLLRLYRNAYVGEKLVFRRGAFPNLKEVDIYFLKQLKEIIFEEGTTPQIGNIEIYGCRLESGIVGIKHLPRLKVIALQYDGEVAELDMLRAEVDAHPNHPVLQISKDRSNYNLGGIEGSNVAAEVIESLHEHEADSL